MQNGIDILKINAHTQSHSGEYHTHNSFWDLKALYCAVEFAHVSMIYWKPGDCPVKKEPVTLRDHELIRIRRYGEHHGVSP